MILYKGLHCDFGALCCGFVVPVGAEGLVVGFGGMAVAYTWGAVAIEAFEVCEYGGRNLVTEFVDNSVGVTVRADVSASDVADDCGDVEVVVDDACGDHANAVGFDGRFGFPVRGGFPERAKVDIGVGADEGVEVGGPFAGRT